ncbi:hypothetical protein OBBRIDRAFT_869469 [Obba rivulosa]|uniref:Uncharacterized protein n=1 Tax=Obba rivulosa TaxID=1052685 RepID=A0A8E2DM18_9APHY|nr:hypothetical protein OBBRIDRAFT_869469 [Obba rivulosa]
MVEAEWEEEVSSHTDNPTQPGHGYRRAKASTIHGWVTKLRGTLIGNERARQRGIREMQVASAVRQYHRERKARKRKQRRRGGFFSLFSSSQHKSRSRRDRDRGTTPVVHRDYGHHKRSNAPCLHFPHRARPHHHGHGTRLQGQIMGNREMVLTGRAMNDAARRERDKERRRRRRRQRHEAEAVRADGPAHRWNWRE